MSPYLSSVAPHMVRHYGTLGLLPVEVKVKHLMHFGTSQCHLPCQHCKARKPGNKQRSSGVASVKLKNKQEALVTVEEAGVEVALGQASSGAPSPLGSSV